MIQKIRKILGLETTQERVSSLVDIDSRLKDISIELGVLATDYTSRVQSKNDFLKSVSSESESVNEVNERFNRYEQSHLNKIIPLKKEMDKLHSEKESLLKSKDVSEAYDFKLKFNLIKSKFKAGEVSKKLYDCILKAKHSGKTLYSDFLIFNKEGQLLILKRTKTDDSQPEKWGLPGGHVDPNESHDNAGIRELREETGVCIDSKDANNIGSFVDEDVHIEYYSFNDFCEQEYPITLQSEEHSEYKFIDLSDIDNYEFPFNMKENIKRLLNIEDKKEIIKSEDIEKGKQAKKNKIELVMKEFKEGKLRSSDGSVVTDRKQAIAIALSEAEKVNKGDDCDIEKSKELIDKCMKAYQSQQLSLESLKNIIEKARTHKYIRKTPDGKGGWNYVYEEKEVNESKTDLENTLNKVEKEIVNLDYEHGYCFDKDGKELFNQKGGVGSIVISDENLPKLKGNTFTHNHPSWKKYKDTELEIYGFNISKQDILMACGNELKETRVCSGQYSYSLSKANKENFKLSEALELNSDLDNIETETNIYLRKLSKEKGYSDYYLNALKFHIIYGKLSKKFNLIYKREKLK